MTGHTVYDKCKSRELIEIGVSTSYNEVLKNRKKLADYVVASSINEGPPLPSHFSKGHCSICAFDNFHHADRSSLSRTNSDLDTAVVMFQVKPDIIPSKPNVTAMNPPNSTQHFRNEPPCQLLRNYNKPKSSANLTPNFSVDEDLCQNEELQKDHRKKEFILSLIKTGLIEEQESIPSPSWASCRALICSTNVPMMRTGFLPYLPHHRTFHGFYCSPQFFESSIAAESDSTKFYDEGVFHIVFETVLNNPKEFHKLIPMLGSFHTAKVVEHCIAKYLHGSGVQDALFETGVFGVKAAVYDEWVTLHQITWKDNYSRRCSQYFEMGSLLESKWWSWLWWYFICRRSTENCL